MVLMHDLLKKGVRLMCKYKDTWEGQTEDEILDGFNQLFLDDLESYYTDTIACCDNCFDDFVEKWPAVYQRDLRFQTHSLDLSSFLEQSRLADFFTQEEFSRYIQRLKCPRCGSPLRYNIWTYDFGFDLPDDFEQTLMEINEIAKRTPFLLLSHPFAKTTYEEIVILGSQTPKRPLEKSLFRARKLKTGKVYNEDDFYTPKKDLIEEGRYNHAGQPVLYLAEDIETCYYELRRPIDGIASAEIHISNSIRVLDLLDDLSMEANVIEAIKWSSLMSSPREGQSWFKPHYVFTRFVADCAVAGGFDAIRFPSVRSEKGGNIVLLNPDTLRDKISIQNIQLIAKL